MRWRSIAAAAIGVAGAAIWYVASWRVPPSAVGWREDYDAALREARARGRPVLVEFYANWCGPCRAMERAVFSRPEPAAAIEGLVIPVRVDLSAERRNRAGVALSRRFAVSAVPAFRVADGDGRLLARRDGSMSAEELLEWLRSAVAAAGQGRPRSPPKD